MGAYFAQTLDQLKMIYVNLRQFMSLHIRFRSIYVNLRPNLVKYDEKMSQMTKYMSKKSRDVIFPGKKTLQGATQHRRGLVNNVIKVIKVISVIVIYVDLQTFM